MCLSSNAIINLILKILKSIDPSARHLWGDLGCAFKNGCVICELVYNIPYRRARAWPCGRASKGILHTICERPLMKTIVLYQYAILRSLTRLPTLIFLMTISYIQSIHLGPSSKDVRHNLGFKFQSPSPCPSKFPKPLFPGRPRLDYPTFILTIIFPTIIFTHF